MSSVSVDLRGFVYPLAAQLEKHRWELERLQGKIAQAGARLSKLEIQLKENEENYVAQHAHLAKSMQLRPDPEMYRRALDFLVHARDLIKGCKQDVEEVRQERLQLMDLCIERQRKIEMLEEHRSAQMQEYVLSEQTRLASELDREWSARSLWQLRQKSVLAAPMQSSVEGAA